MTDTNLLFWNLYGKDNATLIHKALYEFDVDIALFAEHQGVDWRALEKKSGYTYIAGYGGCTKIVLLAKSAWLLEVKQEQARYVLYRVTSPISKKTFVLCGVHLQDRHNSHDSSVRLKTIERLTYDVDACESTCKTKRTIIVGDLNSNPYDQELISIMGFNAVLFKEVIRNKEKITVGKVQYRRLYNPILNYISEDTQMYGSIYNTSERGNTPVWHCFDQLLVSRVLIDEIQNMSYIKKIGTTSLMAKVQPNVKYSDHLPLLVEMKERC